MADGAEFAWPGDAVELGRIAGAWGVKGWIRVLPYAGNPLVLCANEHWLVKPPGKRGAQLSGAGAFPSRLTILRIKEHGDGVIVQAQGVHNRDTAEALSGARIFLARRSFPPAAPDEYYWVDLIGLTVVRLQGEKLGTVVGLIDTGAHSVLRVAPDAVPGGKTAPELERLIPFTAVHVAGVSLEERQITVDWGLDY